MRETVTLPTGEIVPVSTPPDVPGLRIVAWADMPGWAAQAFRKWHIGGQHPLGPYVYDFKAWVRSLKPAQPVSIEEMNEAIARQGAKAGGSYLEKTSPFYRWGKTAEVKFGNEDFDDLPEKDWLRMAAISAGVRYTNPPTKEQLGEMLATGHVQIQWETHVRQVIEEFPSIGFVGLIQQVAQTHGLSPEQVAGNIEKLARELHCARIGKRVGT